MKGQKIRIVNSRLYERPWFEIKIRGRYFFVFIKSELETLCAEHFEIMIQIKLNKITEKRINAFGTGCEEIKSYVDSKNH